MPSWWETAKKILSGKPKGAKLIILGVFLVSLDRALDILSSIYGNPTSSWALTMLGIFAFMNGVWMYREEAEAELEKK